MRRKTKAAGTCCPIMLRNLRISLVLLGAIAQVVLGGLPFILKWEHTIASRSSDIQTFTIPASYAFSIWNVLFLGCFVFGIIQALPKYRDDPMTSRVAWLATIALWGNAIWEIYVPLYGFKLPSLMIIAGMILAPLTIILFKLKEADDRRWFFIPLAMLCGWVSVATFVNLSVTALFLAFNPFALSESTQAVIVIVTAGIVTIGYAYYFKNLLYNACVLWGFVGIYVANSQDNVPIAMISLALGILGITVAILRKIEIFKGFRLRSEYS